MNEVETREVCIGGFSCIYWVYPKKPYVEFQLHNPYGVFRLYCGTEAMRGPRNWVIV